MLNVSKHSLLLWDKINMRIKYNLFCLLFLLMAESGLSLQPRSLEEYFNEENVDIKILVVGSGHNVRAYQKNYFLVDIDENNAPDLVADFSEYKFPEELKEKFDIVLWEYVPHQVLPKKGTLDNFKFVLKKERGMVIGNLPVTMVYKNDYLNFDENDSEKEDDINSEEDEPEKVFKKKGCDVSSPEWWAMYVEPNDYLCQFNIFSEYPYLCFVSELEGEKKSLEEFKKFFSETISREGDFNSVTFFDPLERQPDVWRAAPDLQGYFMIVK